MAANTAEGRRMLEACERNRVRLMIAYLLSTIAIFAFGPVDWPIENWKTLFVFLGAVLASELVVRRHDRHGAEDDRDTDATR